MPAGRQDGPMVLPRAFALLRLLAHEPGGLTLSAISAALEVPKSSLSSTLKALVDQKYLQRTGQLYSLGGESYALASVILAGRSLRQIARPVLEQVCAQTGETVLLGVPSGDGASISYIDFVESAKSVRFAVEVGSTRPLYASACGLVILAAMPDAERAQYFASADLAALTSVTITDPARIAARLDQIRTEGFAMTSGDYSPDAAGFAAPVRGSDGNVVAALNIGVPVTRGARDAAQLQRAAMEGANEISRILGYQGDSHR